MTSPSPEPQHWQPSPSPASYDPYRDPPPPPPPSFSDLAAGHGRTQAPQTAPVSAYAQLSSIPPGTNGFAITSLVLGIFPICAGLPALIFGLIALGQVRKSGQRGKGLAIAGISLAGLWMAGIAVGGVVSIINGADREASGSVTGAGDVSETSLRVGDCIKEVKEGVALYHLPAVPCDQPHEAEVVGEFTPIGKSYPGEDAIFAQADLWCEEMLAKYAGDNIDAADNVLYLYPRASDWRKGSKTVTCLSFHKPPRTGSLRG